MKTFARLAAGLCICAIASQANAWSQPTHKNIVKDALAFMNSSYATEEMRQAYLAGCVGKVYPVLFEQDKDGRSVGHAPN